jgi:glycosyltransferase involved in cell wall biosynthesis
MHPAINLLPRRLRRLGVKRPSILTTFHDLKVPYLFPKAGPLRRWVVAELARSSDGAITTNREDYETLRKTLPSPPALIPIGSNISPEPPAKYDRDAWRTRWGADPDTLLLSFFGFVNDRKGVDTLLRALHLLVSDADRAVDARLLMIGAQTGASDPTNVAYLAHIQDLISELDLSARICWTDFLPADQVSASFLASDLCVLPFRDGVSFLHGTLHAALAHGMPIITTQPRIPLPELANERNVLLVPQEQPQALANAIARLAADPDLVHTLSDGARALSHQFQWSKIATDTLALYRATRAQV